MRRKLTLGFVVLFAMGLLVGGCGSPAEQGPMDTTANDGGIAEPTAADTIYTTTSTSDTSLGDTTMTETTMESTGRTGPTITDPE